MSTSLAVKYRPTGLDDQIVGQSSIVKILKREVDTNTFSNAYVFNGASGCGKAQPLYENVLTPEGFIKMKDVTVDTVVVDGKGHSCKVTGVYPQGVKDCYRIHFTDGTFIDVADEHLNTVWYSDRGEKKYQTITTLELIDLYEKRKNISRIHIDIPIIDCWEDNNIDIDPYLLGALIGDGGLHDGLSFSNNETDVVSKVNEKLHAWDLELKHADYLPSWDYGIGYISDSLVSYKTRLDNNVYTTLSGLCKELISRGFEKTGIFDSVKSYIKNRFAGKSCKTFSHKDLYEFLDSNLEILDYNVKSGRNMSNEGENPRLYNRIKDYGLNVKSVDKFIPTNYLHSSVGTRLELLRGLLDTVSDKGGRDFGTSSPRLADDFEFLVRSLGMKCTRREAHTSSYTKPETGERIELNTKCYSFYFRASNSMRVTSSKRQEDSWVPAQREPEKSIDSIERIDPQECQCIMVDSPEHTYITSGFTVTHNTTMARAFAKAINRGKGSPIEIDAASNSGVDNVKNIIHSASERALDSEYKIYIIDEAHGLSNAAWQAFLKCIEEPPKYTIFIFCTTEKNKIPETIKNRCQVFNFNRIPSSLICERLKYICSSEGVTNYYDACDYISRTCNNEMRNGISLLEKCLSYRDVGTSDLTLESAVAALGDFSYTTYFNLINNVIDGNNQEVLLIIDSIYNSGTDMKLFVDQFLTFCLDLYKYSLMKSCLVTHLPKNFEEDLKYATGIENPLNVFNVCVDTIMSLKNMLKTDPNPKSTVEVSFIKLINSIC